MPRPPLSREDQNAIPRLLLINFVVYLFIGSMAMIWIKLDFTALLSGYAQAHSIIINSAQVKN
jgi:hypothetical protein